MKKSIIIGISGGVSVIIIIILIVVYFNSAKEGDVCKPTSTVLHSHLHVYDKDLNCVPTACEDGYTISKEAGGCAKIGGTCIPSNTTKIPTYSKPFAYDTSGNCMFQGCMDGRALSTVENTCFKIGDVCTVPPGSTKQDNEKPYVYDKYGNCPMPSCMDGYIRMGDTTCKKVNDTCSNVFMPVDANRDHLYVTVDGICTGISCVTGYVPTNGLCARTITTATVPAAGVSCTPTALIPNASTYVTDADGNCTIVTACGTDYNKVGNTCVIKNCTEKPLVTGVSAWSGTNWGTGGNGCVPTCDTGYEINNGVCTAVPVSVVTQPTAD